MSKTLTENLQRNLEEKSEIVKSQLKLSKESKGFFDDLLTFIKDFYERDNEIRKKLNFTDVIFRILLVLGSLLLLLFK